MHLCILPQRYNWRSLDCLDRTAPLQLLVTLQSETLRNLVHQKTGNSSSQKEKSFSSALQPHTQACWSSKGIFQKESSQFEISANNAVPKACLPQEIGNYVWKWWSSCQRYTRTLWPDVCRRLLGPTQGLDACSLQSPPKLLPLLPPFP